jgi:membrane-associated protease RseP (regulator of RpoE activity)
VLQRPGKRAERVTFGLFVALLVGLFGAELAIDYTPGKLGALFCFLFWFPLLVLHELGHAAAARAFGCRVTRISLGYGSTLWRFRIGTATVDLKSIPVEGFVRFDHGARPIGRLANAFVYFAGPGTELLLAGLLIAVLGTDQLLGPTDHIGLIAARSLCICIGISAFSNLVPHTSGADLDSITDGRRPSPNDGLGILISLFGTRG